MLVTSLFLYSCTIYSTASASIQRHVYYYTGKHKIFISLIYSAAKKKKEHHHHHHQSSVVFVFKKSFLGCCWSSKLLYMKNGSLFYRAAALLNRFKRCIAHLVDVFRCGSYSPQLYSFFFLLGPTTYVIPLSCYIFVVIPLKILWAALH
jgi:hypothetical protein